MGNVKNAKIWGSLRVPHSDSTPGAEMGKQGSDSNWESNTNPLQTPPDPCGRDAKGQEQLRGEVIPQLNLMPWFSTLWRREPKPKHSLCYQVNASSSNLYNQHPEDLSHGKQRFPRFFLQGRGQAGSKLWVLVVGGSRWDGSSGCCSVSMSQVMLPAPRGW